MARFFAASGDKSNPDITSKPPCQATSSSSSSSSRTSGGSPPSKELARPAGGNTKNGDGKSNANVHRRNRRPRLRRQNGQDFDHSVEKSRVSTPARSSSDLFGSGFTEAPSSASSASSQSQSKVCCACSPSVSIVEDLPGEVSEDDFSWLEAEPAVSVAPSAAVDEADFSCGDAHKDGPSISRKEKKKQQQQQQQQQPRQQQQQPRQQQQQPRRHKNHQRIRPKYLAPLELRVEDFECGDCIGKGSYSRVFLGTHMPSGTEWALKVVSKRKTFETRENLAHLREEKKISSKLQSSDFLVRTAGTFQNPRSVVFAMEYLPGGDLYQRLADKGTLPLGETVAWVAQAVLAIEDLHALDIVHRDVKPENFLMGKSGTLKLTDFGFARELAPGERLLSQFGTPEYVAPEVLNGCGHGKPVDLWALGILIYELLVGHTPFKAASVDDMYERISSGDYAFPPPLSKASPSPIPSPTRSRRQDIRSKRGSSSNKRSEAEAEGKGGRLEGYPNKVVEKKEEIDDAQDPAAQSLVKSLLSLAPARRPSIAEIKDHPFFEGVNFDALRAAVRAQAYAEEEEALVVAAVAGGDVWLRDQPVICLSENVDDHYGNVFADF